MEEQPVIVDECQELKNIKFIYGGKDKLARYNPESEVHQSIGTEGVTIMDETGHFPYFERPEDLSNILEKLITNSDI